MRRLLASVLPAVFAGAVATAAPADPPVPGIDAPDAGTATQPSQASGAVSQAYRESTARALQAYEQGDMRLARTLLDAIAPDIISRRDADMAIVAGWNALRLADYARSSEWFGHAHAWRPTAESAYGRALSAWRQDRLDEAIEHARPYAAGHAPSRELIADVLQARAARTRDDARALADLDAAARYRPPTRDSWLQRGWLLYRLGRFDEAADVFAALYREAPDEDSARGLFEAQMRRGQDDQLGALARGDDGPLGVIWREREAERLYLRKRFLAAGHAAPGAFAGLRNIDSGALAVGASWRNKSGDSGLSRLEAVTLPVVEASQVFDGVNRVFVRGSRLDLDADNLPPGALIGSYPGPGLPYAVTPTTELDGGQAWRIGFRRDGAVSPYVELGQGANGGEESAYLTGLLGVSYDAGEHQLALEAFREPVRESILSYTGIVDPYSGESWGAVRRTGIRARGYKALGNRWGIYGEAEWAELTGEGVADNDALIATLAVSRDLALEGFDYFSIGPALHLQRYDRNLSHFTLGHGGYFSPESLAGLGLSAAFLTAESAEWMVRGLFNVGYQSLEEASSPFFPRAPDGRTYADNDDSGVTFTGQLESVWRLSDHWQAGASLFLQRSPEFDDEAANLFLRYLFRPRPAVFSSDLPAPALQTFP